jgi:hypothetical protein
MRIFLLLLILTFSQMTVSATELKGAVLLGWNPPTQREDNTPLALDEIRYYWVDITNVATLKNDRFATTTNNPYQEVILPYGKYIVKYIACDTNGLCSRWSSDKAIVVKSPPKKPLYPSAKVI